MKIFNNKKHWLGEARANKIVMSVSIVFCFWRWGVRARGSYWSLNGTDSKEAMSGAASALSSPYCRTKPSILSNLSDGESSRSNFRKHIPENR
jgi:hypothetical protein